MGTIVPISQRHRAGGLWRTRKTFGVAIVREGCGGLAKLLAPRMRTLFCRSNRPSSGPCVAVFIPCVCLCVRYQTPFSSRHESGPSWFLSTGKHPVGGQLPRVFFSALPGQSSDRPNLPPHKKLSIFQFPFASIRRAPSEVCSGLGKRRIDHSTSKRSTKKLQRAAITAFFLDRSLVVVHCDRS